MKGPLKVSLGSVPAVAALIGMGAGAWSFAWRHVEGTSGVASAAAHASPSRPGHDPSGTEAVLRAPSRGDWRAHFEAPRLRPAAEGTRALAYQYDTTLFEPQQGRVRAAGIVRRGMRFPVLREVDAPGCKGGTWYEVPGGGLACSTDGFHVASELPRFDKGAPAPRMQRPLPFDYAQVVAEDALRYYRIPTPSEEQQARNAPDAALPEVVEERMRGDFFIAIDRLEEDSGRRFYRTVRGRYVRAEAVEAVELSDMRGEPLGEGLSLPLAFVYEQPEPMFRLEQGRLRRIGVAEKQARLPVVDKLSHEGVEYLQGPEARLLRRDGTRLVERRARPDGIEPGAKWVHVDLDAQSLVAYEGDEPVYATLISSGKEGYEPPLGLFRVRHKYVSTTMRGDDPIDGVYDVEEVPWTQYYWEGYALHGAYWHDGFGSTRSHGCTNLAPADARWLFFWSSPQVPAGWHGRTRVSGTHVFFTREG